jgi:DnaA family protein
MRQLALDIRLDDYAVFTSFHAGPNSLAVANLQAAAGGAGAPVVWVWGAPGSGRSHLLQATVARAHDRGAATAYLPLATLRRRAASIIEGMGGLDLLAVDDAPAVAGDDEWERALFRLYEELCSRGARLIAAGHAPPTHAGFVLRDLASRFAAGAIYRLEELADDQHLAALQLRARWRGFELPEDTARYLLSRVQRDAASLFRLLDRLDLEALAAQKRLTIPFVKTVLSTDD